MRLRSLFIVLIFVVAVFVSRESFCQHQQLSERGHRSSYETSREVCVFPPVADGFKVISIGVYEGSALSTVTAIGQDKETEAIEVIIEEGFPDSYLILSSHNPVMWVLRGNTNAIKKVVVNSSYIFQIGRGSGVVGVDKEQAFFAKRECVPYYNDTKTDKFFVARNMIKRTIGQFPDFIYGVYEAGRIIIQGDGKISSTKDTYTKNDLLSDSIAMHRMLMREQGTPTRPKYANPLDKFRRPAPEGFDASTWGKVLNDYPSGVIEIDPASVVSDGKVVAYEILPGPAGISRLVYQNALERISQKEFRIIKNISHFPIGLSRWQAVKFLIAPGIKIPDGRMGYSCVILEETGEIVNNTELCK